MSLPKVFHLKQGDTLLATLTGCAPIEMFWLGCEIAPTEAFKAIEPLFRKASDTEDVDVIDDCFDQLDAMGVILVDATNQQKVSQFSMFFAENGIRLRFVIDSEQAE